MCPPPQGEDVVAGIRTPEPMETLARTLPAAYQALLDNCALLEKHYKDMQAGHGAGGSEGFGSWRA
jgi:phosphoenolpyruvate synthase/pyruvate phosphate dikinase